MQKATSCTLELDPLPTPTLVRLRASEQGITLTDVQRRSVLRAVCSSLLCSALCSTPGWAGSAHSTAWCCSQCSGWWCSGGAGLGPQTPRGAPCPDAVPPPRRVFFRRHYPLTAVRFCGMDPEGRK